MRAVAARPLACLLLALALAAARGGSSQVPPAAERIGDIPAATVAVPAMAPGDAALIPPQEYWRGNADWDGSTLVALKSRYPHVPTLVEYALDLGEGGEYDLQARYVAAEPSPTLLSVDGEPAGIAFAGAFDTGEGWVTLARLKLRPGRRMLRLTGRHVETPFPRLQGLRLIFRGGAVPPEPPAPRVVGYRASLPENWHRTISRKIHGDFHTGGFVKGVGKQFNPEEYADTLARNHVNAICVFAKGHHGYAYYNTRVGTRHPGLDFDLMKAQIDACHRRGIAVWVYFSIAVDELYGSTLAARPVQRGHFLNVDARIGTHYVRDYTWPMVVECVRDYDLDGFFFDFPGNEEFVQETVRIIKRIKPGVAVAYNHQWDKTRDELKKLDVLEIESWMHKQTLYHWQYVARYARCAVPLTAMNTRFWTGWGDFGGIADEAKLRFDVATALANGCAITVGDQLHPYGRLDREVYDRIGRALAYAKEVEPYVDGAESVPYVALLRQSETACHALVDAGIHFTVIDPTQDPQPFKLIVVPDGSQLTPELGRKLEAYVGSGGRLLMMGSPGPEAARLAGIQPVPGARPEPAHLRLSRSALPTPPPTDVYSYQDMQVVRPLPGTAQVIPMVWPLNHGTPHHVSHRHSPAMEEPSGYPAITSRRLGRGEVIYSAAPLLEVYAKQGVTVMRQVVEDLVRRLVPPAERVADVHSPAPVEVSVTRQGARLVVHLVHCAQSRRVNATTAEADLVHKDPIIDGLVTLSGVELRLAAALVEGKKLRLLPGGKSGPRARVRDGVARIEVPPFQTATVLVWE